MYLSLLKAAVMLMLLYSFNLVANPLYNCSKLRAEQQISIDGVLDETAWVNAEGVQLVNSQTGEAIDLETTAKLLWDETFLYLGIDALDSNIKGAYTNHDDLIYKEDALEIFIDPDSDGENYYEIEWNCLNTVLDLMIYKPFGGSDIAWHAEGLESQIGVKGTVNEDTDTDTSITLEAAIPWSAIESYAPLNTPQANQIIQLNIYRIKYPIGKDIELYAWSPTMQGTFHVPSAFGTVKLIDNTTEILNQENSLLPSGISITDETKLLHITVNNKNQLIHRCHIYSLFGKKLGSYSSEHSPTIIVPKSDCPTGPFLISIETEKVTLHTLYSIQ